MYRKNRAFVLVVVLTALSVIVLWGCPQNKGREIPLEEEILEDVPMPQVPSTVMVPAEVSSKWKAIVLELTDKDTNEQSDVTVNIGETIPLAGTGFSIYVEAFLPSFTMAGDVFTSSSADLNNPAARVKITDSQGQQLFYSWLFALYPATHPFEHPKYGLILKDYVAAK